MKLINIFNSVVLVTCMASFSEASKTELRFKDYRREQQSALAPFPAYWTPLGKPKDSPEVKGIKIRWDGEKFTLRRPEAAISNWGLLTFLIVSGICGWILITYYLGIILSWWR